jgi:hypothetical protein
VLRGFVGHAEGDSTGEPVGFGGRKEPSGLGDPTRSGSASVICAACFRFLWLTTIPLKIRAAPISKGSTPTIQMRLRISTAASETRPQAISPPMNTNRKIINPTPYL